MKRFFLLGGLLAVIAVHAQTAEEIQRIQATYNMDKLEALLAKFQAEDKNRQERLTRLAKQNNWQIYQPNSARGFDQLMDVSEDGNPIYYTLDNINAAYSTRANHLNTGGSLGLNLNGQGMTAYVWDGGPVRTTHQEFGGRVSIGDGIVAINVNSDHATHVTGTIGAAGVDPGAKGMGYQCSVITREWNSDLTEATAAAMGGMLLSNHSYGYSAGSTQDWQFGAYITISRDWDDLLYNAPYYLMVKSAGNDGNDDVSNALPLDGNAAYDKLRDRGTSKNNLVVANAQDANVAANGDLIAVAINSGSSEGPTDDYRIKPDITGNGTSLYSSIATNNSSYASYTGTSMSSPNVTGSLLLLQQHYHNLNGNFMRAATLKGLALHTADEAGSAGPDAIFGWGLLNALRAAQTITNNETYAFIQELTLNQGETYILNVDSDNVSPLLASISWTDPPGTANPGNANQTTPVLVNDLDIRITQGGATYFPYRLTSITTNGLGDNNVDPYERVNVAGAGGSYTITVSHKGILTNGPQHFSLIVTGIDTDPCTSDVIITGNNYSTPLTESDTWIVSSGQTTILNTADVRLDADPADGYIQFNPPVANDFFHSQPIGNGVFVAQALDGCNVLAPAKMNPSFTDTKPTPSGNGEITTTGSDRIEESDLLPGGFALYQNNPNPFSKNTTIGAVVPEAVKQANIILYNLQGVALAMYPIEERGKVSVEISGGRFPSGMYLYALVADGQVIDTKKMILMD